jgi:hypothetical protein
VPWRFSAPPRLKAAHSRRTPKRSARNERPASSRFMVPMHAKNRNEALHVAFFATCFVAILLAGCSTPATHEIPPSFVRSVDYAGLPQAKALAERARQIGNQMYPEVCAQLLDGKSRAPRHFDISFKKELAHGNSGGTQINHIYLNAKYLEEWKRDIATFDSVLVHEMAHVAQHYERPIIGKWIVFHHTPSSWLVEGIADYVTFKLGETNGWRCAECSSSFPDYRDGYSCAAAFLFYIEREYDKDIVTKLNTRLRHGGFSEELFAKWTGKDLPTLWGDFQKTSGFTPSAARMLDLQQSLGFVAGKPPKDVEQRLARYLEKSLDPPTRKLITGAQIPGLAAGNLNGRLAILAYFTQPGGTAEAFITDLKNRNKLPGFSNDDHGTLSGALNTRDLAPKFPIIRSFTAEKLDGDGSTYHYSIFRASPDSDWALQRAWRTTPEGGLLEEYSVQ